LHVEACFFADFTNRSIVGELVRVNVATWWQPHLELAVEQE
jgi:hypothetical protein